MVQDAARKAGFAASIGVTGGKVFAGLVGSDRHMEYTVIGDAVNRAAALFAFLDGVEGVVAERIASLAPAQQLTLKVAAVLGRNFDLDLLSQLHPAGTARAALADEIAAAQRKGLVEPVDAESGKHRFRHAIIGNTAYKLLVSDQRRKLDAKTAARRMARQYRAGKPTAGLAAGGASWYRGKQSDAAKHRLASAQTAAERGMHYNQAQALFRLDQAECATSDHASPGWQALLAQLGIARPEIWSIATG